MVSPPIQINADLSATACALVFSRALSTKPVLTPIKCGHISRNKFPFLLGMPFKKMFFVWVVGIYRRKSVMGDGENHTKARVAIDVR